MGSNSYGQSNTPSEKIFINKGSYTYSFKKTEKLVTALYMVTDCMDVNDALKAKVRTLAIELLSFINRLSRPTSSPLDNKSYISNSIVNIDEILSLIDIGNTIGFISDMNTEILKKELTNLKSELGVNQSEDNRFSFVLDGNMFNLPRQNENLIDSNTNLIKDKRTDYNMSFINNNSNKPLSLIKKIPRTINTIISKQDRTEKILMLIKDKKNLSIKDISIAFTDCSEKTIQRELNSLVSGGKINKTGAKRWSRYTAI